MVCVLFYCLVFFFKQKTAYEMRISDWSSDVCSSDLWLVRPASSDGGFLDVYGELRVRAETQRRARMTVAPDQRHLNIVGTLHGGFLMAIVDHALFAGPMALGIERSEEHPSELQSLMRISYAVFCLKKKNNKKK